MVAIRLELLTVHSPSLSPYHSGEIDSGSYRLQLYWKPKYANRWTWITFALFPTEGSARSHLRSVWQSDNQWWKCQRGREFLG